jgi:ABC-type lipoprotein export system ATPase subunit
MDGGYNTTFIIVSHDLNLTKNTDHQLELKDRQMFKAPELISHKSKKVVLVRKF